MNPAPRMLELFAGIGGIGLGLHHALNAHTVAVCEHDPKQPYPAAVLAKRFPHAPNLGDVSTIDWQQVARDHGPIDIICGGFPCQDISLAGKGRGIADGTRSGLWRHFADAIRILRPRVVVVENVAALLARGIDRVILDLATCGLDVSWDCIPAAAVGAPHRRDRVFLIAYPAQLQRPAVIWHEPNGTAQRMAASGVMWPTPTVQVSKHGAATEWELSRDPSWDHLGARVGRLEREQFPTPKASPSGPDFARLNREGAGGDDLATHIARQQMFPTPTVADATGGRTSKGKDRPGEGGLSVTVKAMEQFPTPRASEGKGVGPIGSKSHAHRLDKGYLDATVQERAGVSAPLNPGFVEWLMGFPQGWTDLAVDVAPEIDIDPWSAGEWDGVPRVLAGVEKRVARLHCLGNAVVPQAAAHVGEVIRRNNLLGEGTV